MVPYSIEAALSGIGKQEELENMWYQKVIVLDEKQLQKRCILHFDGVDYTAKVWMNGQYVGRHDGAYTRFSFDISEYVAAGDNVLVVKVEDSFNIEQPRGKQRWLPNNYSCWYVQTTGIWKSVWMEFVEEVHIERIKFTPVVSEYVLNFEYFLNKKQNNVSLEIQISRDNRLQKKMKLDHINQSGHVGIDLVSLYEEHQVELWRLEKPSLYDVKLVLAQDDVVVDEVESYFGFREFKQEGRLLCLNGMPVYQKLVLYQGYWENSGLSAPDEEAMIKDLEMIKEMGYNGLRIHQKIESELFLYHADRLGLLVWCEMPSPHLFNDNMKERVTKEWIDIVRQYYNHPSIITWLIFNESWGIRGVKHNKEMQAFADGLYYLTKALDPMRPVIANDGWEHAKTDIVSIHHYEQDADKLYDMHKDLDAVMSRKSTALIQHSVFSKGYVYEDQPVIMSEFGGCGFKSDMEKNDWGYSAADSQEQFYDRFGSLVKAVKKLEYMCGYCYTQFSDVEQEKNGLVTMNRTYKVDPQKIRQINEGGIL